MKKKCKLVFTFGVGTAFAGKVVVVECDDVMNALTYVFNKYGNLNVCTNYHYDKKSLKNGCAWKDGLFEEIKDTCDYGKDLIKKYKYEVIEEITLGELN